MDWKGNLKCMATVSSLHFPTMRSLHSPSTAPTPPRECRDSSSILCFNRTQSAKKSTTTSRIRCQDQSLTKRRDALIQIFFSAISFPSFAATSSAETDVKEDFLVYSDEENKFKISIPRGWLFGTGEPDGYKSITAFYPKEASTSNVTVVITGLGPDFTRLESFGTVDAFAETLVSGLDRSWQRPPGVSAKLLNSKAGNGLYYIEYSLQNPGESRRHLFSAIGMANNGWYNRLYTVTGQFVEEESEKYESKVEKFPGKLNSTTQLPHTKTEVFFHEKAYKGCSEKTMRLSDTKVCSLTRIVEEVIPFNRMRKENFAVLSSSQV